jgi:fructose-bisphosphate aldolase class II
MPIATLTDVLSPALSEGYAVLGAVVLGWEDAEAYVVAAEEVGCAIILQAGPKFRETLPVDISGLMFRKLGEASSVPVVAHIDHAKSVEECRAGVDAGFTSVMYDGSELPVSQNVENTSNVVAIARPHGVSVEAEIGFVGYAEGAVSEMTDPKEAAQLANETDCDALAISIGNVHLQQTQKSKIDLDRLAEIEAETNCPLVIHGASGVPVEMRRHLARHTRVCKFNIGTDFRREFGSSLRSILVNDPEIFDRGQILRATRPALTKLATETIRSIQ